MKLFVSLFAVALLCSVSSLPIHEGSIGGGGSAATLPGDPKIEAKSEVPSTPLTEEKQTESAAKESSSPAPSSTLANDERSSSPAPKDELVPQPPKAAALPSPAVPQPADASNKTPNSHKVGAAVEDAVKSEAGTKPAPIPSESVEKFDKIEQLPASSEQPKELNNQVNAISVDEPKPVQNEVKSEIPKEESTKSEPATKEDVKSEKHEEKKDEKPAPILSAIEAKPTDNKHVVEELKKSTTPNSSEEKTDSQDASKGAEKKEPAKHDHSAESSEEKKSEKPLDAPKKEDSSVRPLAGESQPTETAKPSPSAVSPLPAEKSPEKPESDKDVIKREAAGKDKHDEKKSTENFTKKDKTKTSQQPTKETQQRRR